MLGLSFGKLFLLIVLIVVVWYGFKHVTRVDQLRQGAGRGQAGTRASTGGRGASPRIEAEDMTKCAACGAYVAARGATNCGRSDCPW